MANDITTTVGTGGPQAMQAAQAAPKTCKDSKEMAKHQRKMLQAAEEVVHYAEHNKTPAGTLTASLVVLMHQDGRTIKQTTEWSGLNDADHKVIMDSIKNAS